MANDISKKKGKSSGEKKAKRKAKRRETYAMYIYKVLKQVGEGSATSTLVSVFHNPVLNAPFSHAPSGASGHRDFQQSHEHHELLRE